MLELRRADARENIQLFVMVVGQFKIYLDSWVLHGLSDNN
jgi:hypothetical protein